MDKLHLPFILLYCAIAHIRFCQPTCFDEPLCSSVRLGRSGFDNCMGCMVVSGVSVPRCSAGYPYRSERYVIHDFNFSNDYLFGIIFYSFR